MVAYHPRKEPQSNALPRTTLRYQFRRSVSPHQDGPPGRLYNDGHAGYRAPARFVNQPLTRPGKPGHPLPSERAGWRRAQLGGPKGWLVPALEPLREIAQS
jgi:hypothetical protein